MIRANVATKYDVKFQQWRGACDFDQLLKAWSELYEILIPEDKWGLDYNCDEGHDWYEFEKEPLRKLLDKLDTCTEKGRKLYLPEIDVENDSEVAESAFDVDVRTALKELLDISENMDYVRVEFD